MSFLDELKAKKGLGKNAPPPKVVETEDTVITCDWSDCKNGDDLRDYKGKAYCPGHYENMLDMDSKKELPTEKPKEKFQAIPKQETREEWLNKAFNAIGIQLFNRPVPKCRISIGFPAGSRAGTNKTLGQFWQSGATSDGIPQIFISPSKSASGDAVEMLAVLVHEMVHAVHPGLGHGSEFRNTAKKVGLTGKMTSTIPTKQLSEKLQAIADTLGKFPHGTIDLTARKKQTTRMLKHECTNCGLILYMTQKWADKCGDTGHESALCPSRGCGSGMRT